MIKFYERKIGTVDYLQIIDGRLIEIGVSNPPTEKHHLTFDISLKRINFKWHFWWNFELMINYKRLSLYSGFKKIDYGAYNLI